MTINSASFIANLHTIDSDTLMLRAAREEHVRAAIGHITHKLLHSIEQEFQLAENANGQMLRDMKMMVAQMWQFAREKFAAYVLEHVGETGANLYCLRVPSGWSNECADFVIGFGSHLFVSAGYNPYGPSGVSASTAPGSYKPGQGRMLMYRQNWTAGPAQDLVDTWL